MIITRSKLEDFHSIKSVIAQSFRECVADSWSDSAVKEFMRNDLSFHKLGSLIENGPASFHCLSGEKIVGAIVFASHSKLSYLFVLKEYQHLGIGKKLFEEAKQALLAKAEVEYIEITSSDYATRAYQSLGFYSSSRPFIYNDCKFQPMVYWLGNDRLENKVEFID